MRSTAFAEPSEHYRPPLKAKPIGLHILEMPL
jgi:hypothetical protein